MSRALLRDIPFSYLWILNKAIGSDIKTVLDIGCGTGELMKVLAKGRNWEITGVDIYDESLELAKKSGAYNKIIKSDITTLPSNVTNQKYDLVFSSQVVEHLPKEAALRVIKQMEVLSRKKTVVTTIVGSMEFSPIEYDREDEENPFQKHRSSWDPNEFQNLGFTTKGQGLYLIYRDGYLGHKAPKTIMPVLTALAFAAAPLVYYFPTLGTYQVASKEVKL